MYTLADKDKERLERLMDAAQAAYDSALLIRNTQSRSVLKTDVAIAALYEAVQQARRVTYKPVTERNKRESAR